MKILLINPLGTPFEVLSPPLSLAYIAQYARKVFPDLEFKIFDFEKEKLPLQEQLRTIKNESPEIIGVTALTPNFHGAMKLARALKEWNPSIPVIMGGVHVTAMKVPLRDVDTVVIGEGEVAFTELIEMIKRGQKLPSLYSVPLMKNIDLIPAWDLIDIDSYKFFAPFKRKKQAVVYWSRGCPFNCVFCSNAVWRTGVPRVRYRSPENIVEELLILKRNYQIGEVYVFDDEVNTNPEWLLRVLNELIDRRVDIYWKCQMRASRALVSEELLRKMKEAGCWEIAWGIESGNNRVLKGIKKRLTVEEVESSLRIAKKYGIVNQGLFMIGNIWLEDGRLEGETVDEAIETIEFAKRLRDEGLLDFIQFNVATPFPGSEMWEIVNNLGLMLKEYEESFYFDTHSPVFRYPHITHEEIQRLHRKAWKEFVMSPSLLLRHLFRIRSLEEFRNFIRSAGVALKVLLTGHARRLKLKE